MKIVVLDGFCLNPGDISWKPLEDLGQLTVYERSAGDESEIIARIKDADAVYTNKTPLNQAVLKACPNLKFIGVLATGYNVVDVECAKELGIPVCNVPSYGTEAVAQFAVAMLLEICHHVADHSKAVHDGRWSECKDFCFWDYPLIELSGKTMGIIGFGRIGQATGRIARALGMYVIAYDKFPSESGKAIAEYVKLEQLFSDSDVIALHCPLFPENVGLINKNTIAKMKKGVILLNNSRGPLIKEEDLAEALNSGYVYAAGLDVVSTEPIHPDNPLLKAKNCFITPHISWASKESRQRLLNTAAANLLSYQMGKLENVVYQD